MDFTLLSPLWGEARGNGGINGSFYTSIITVRGDKESGGINGWFVHVRLYCGGGKWGNGSFMGDLWTANMELVK